MNTINLIYPQLSSVHFEKIYFPDSQPHIKLDSNQLDSLERNKPIRILTRLTSANDVLIALMVKNILDYHEFVHVELHISYLLAARMDRVMGAGEPFTLKLIAGLINGASFRKVKIFDPHSEVSTALIDRSYTVTNHAFVRHALDLYFNQTKVNEFCLVSPDAGALKKIHQLAQFLGINNVVECMKEREVSSGKLKNFSTTTSDLTGVTCFLIDDICDGGGTFIGTSSLLKSLGAEKVVLIVSHGIFSKGTFLEGIDEIFTTDSFRSVDNLTCLPVTNYL